ncbi:DUF6445 family protein [Haliangium sp.]|uniref:DUF6445 family protein n=1 Tax=Haliangium sp. TaxID=2663208 RepID=UPI003D0AE048
MQLQLNPDRGVRLHALGTSTVVVVDDTFANLDELRADALDAGYRRPASAYPGLQAPVSPGGGAEFARELARLMLNALWGDDWPRTIALDAMVAEYFYSVLQLAERPRDLVEQHVDTGHWLASVTYLSGSRGAEAVGDSGEPEEGTAFWRHRKTGLTCWLTGADPVRLIWLQELFGLRFLDELPDALSACPRPDQLQLAADIWRPRPDRPRTLFSAHSDDDWELLLCIPAKRNRTVAYPGWLFHSAVSAAARAQPSDREALRLTLTGFGTLPVTWANKPRYEPGSYPLPSSLGLRE